MSETLLLSPKWMIAKIISTTKPGSYLPVTLLPFIGKDFGNIILMRLYELEEKIPFKICRLVSEPNNTQQLFYIVLRLSDKKNTKI